MFQTLSLQVSTSDGLKAVKLNDMTPSYNSGTSGKFFYTSNLSFEIPVNLRAHIIMLIFRTEL